MCKATHYLIKKFTWLVIFFGLFSLQVDANQATNDFFRANEAYLQGEYLQAINQYETLLASGMQSADIYFNLANAYFRLNQLGKAIFYYRLAQRLSPRDADIGFNLNYALTQRVDKIENEAHVSFWQAVLPTLSQREMHYLLLTTLLAFTFFACMTLFISRQWLITIRQISLLLMVLSFSVWALAQFNQQAFGVIIVEEANIYSGQGKDTVALFSLREGSDFIVEAETDNDWLGIRLADGKKGWVQKASVLYEIND